MNYEKSCGAIVYRKHYGNTEILLIKHIKSGYWSFPKGHMEQGETEIQTAVREIKEETNIDISIDDPSFRETVIFNPRRDTRKEVVYFVARATSHEVKAQEEEISEIRWVEISQAPQHLAYDNDKLIVNRVRAFLAKSRI
ncbi:MAG: NUDIX domain-containing protein [Ruminococcaceae bacterium]|nr:NUDIX domain-containing protein [Oscillospiraceae bacterium]